MSQKLFSTVLIAVVVVFTASCSSGVTGAQDTGDIDRTQPDTVEGVWDTSGDPDQTDLQSGDTDGGITPLSFSTDSISSTTTAERPFRYY